MNKLAGFAFYEVLFLTFLLRRIPEIDSAFRLLESNLPGDPKFNIGGLLFAVAVALLTRSLQLHNKISDLFRIRHKFDLNSILLPLAENVGFNPTEAQLQTIRNNRKPLMYEVFYPYASSRDENPIAGKHNVEHAMDAWSWFWWPVEAILFLLIATMCSAIFGHFLMAAIFLGFSFFAVLVAKIMYPGLREKAGVQVRAIAENEQAKQAILARFNAL